MFRPRAREEQEYSFTLTLKYTPSLTLPRPKHLYFLCSSTPHWCKHHFMNNPLGFAPTPSPTAQPHLASILPFLFLGYASVNSPSGSDNSLRSDI
jgi:hypothetical protein